jgi:hypothetical protein
MLVRAITRGCLVAALLATASAQAQSLKSLRARDAEAAALSREIAYTNSVCDSDMDAAIDWSSSAGWPEGVGLAAACDNALGALEAVCRSGKGKARAQSLRSFVCAGDGSGPALRGASFRYGASPGVNGFGETKSYLSGAF